MEARPVAGLPSARRHSRGCAEAVAAATADVPSRMPCKSSGRSLMLSSKVCVHVRVGFWRARSWWRIAQCLEAEQERRKASSALEAETGSDCKVKGLLTCHMLSTVDEDSLKEKRVVKEREHADQAAQLDIAISQDNTCRSHGSSASFRSSAGLRPKAANGVPPRRNSSKFDAPGHVRASVMRPVMR